MSIGQGMPWFAFLSLLAFLWSPPPAGAAGTDPVLMEELSQLADDLMKAYPSDRYFYVGLGRSPAGLIKALEVKGASVKNVPLSGMGHLKGVNETKLRNFLFPHFEHFLPGPGELAGRQMLVVDWANKGGTLINTKKYLDEHLAAKGSAAPANYLGLHREGNTVPFINYAKDRVEKIPLADELTKAGIKPWAIAGETPLGKAFNGGSTFDNLAEYPSFKAEEAMEEFAAGKPRRELARRPEYAAFGEEFRAYLGGKQAAAPSVLPRTGGTAPACVKQFRRLGPAGRGYSP